MYKKLTIGASLVLVLASLVGLVQTQQTSAVKKEKPDKVTICHRTNSATNPYRMITVSQSSVDGDNGNDNGKGDHYLEHTGPVATSEAVANALKDAKTKWGDIIPPIADVHNGLNWTEAGQAIYYNGCNYVTSETPPTPVAPAVTFTAPTCKALGFYTIPTTEGVTYSINNETVLAGDYTAPNGSTVTVVATAQEGFVIEGTATWTYTFTAPTCDENGQVLGDTTTTSTPSGTAATTIAALPVTSGDSTVANVTLISAAVSLISFLSLVARSVLTRQI